MAVRNPLLIKLASKTHVFWYRLLGGAGATGNYGRAPILLLMTKGRQSGKERTAPLIYQRDGDDLVVIASNGGDDRPPAWWTNLKADPHARVQIMREFRDVVASEAAGAEKQRLWTLMTGVYRNYDDYQKRTSRPIPVVVLKPAPRSTPPDAPMASAAP